MTAHPTRSERARERRPGNNPATLAPPPWDKAHQPAPGESARRELYGMARPPVWPGAVGRVASGTSRALRAEVGIHAGKGSKQALSLAAGGAGGRGCCGRRRWLVGAGVNGNGLDPDGRQTAPCVASSNTRAPGLPAHILHPRTWHAAAGGRTYIVHGRPSVTRPAQNSEPGAETRSVPEGRMHSQGWPSAGVPC